MSYHTEPRTRFRKTAGMSVFAVSAARAAGLRSGLAGPPERGPAEGRAAKAEPVRRRERQLAACCLSAGLLLTFQALAVVPLQAQNTMATGEPHVIYGEPYAGKTVTANKGTIADADGLSNADNGVPGYTYGYQWIRVEGDEEDDISGATDSTYTLTEADEGRRVRVRVSFRDDLDNDESRTSDDFPFYGSIQAGATPATPSADAVELVGNSRQTVAAVLESAGGAFHRRLAQRFTVRAGVDYTLEEVTVCARGENRGLTAAIHAVDGNDSTIPAAGRLHGLVRTSTGTSGDVVFGPSNPSKRSISCSKSDSARSIMSAGMSLGSIVDQSTTIRRATSDFRPIGSSAPFRCAAILICATRLPLLRSSWSVTSDSFTCLPRRS